MAAPDASKKHVLIVDGDSEMACAMAAALKTLDSDIIVDTASDFHSSLSKVLGTGYGTLVVDYMMPGLNGVDLARAVRCISPDTRVMLMTPLETPTLREAARLLGINDVLVKPYQLGQLGQLFRRENSKRGKPRYILLLEKDHDLRQRYAAALRTVDFQVHEVGALEAVRDLFALRRFDVFICVLDAHDGSGVDFVRQRRPTLKGAGTQVIGVTPGGRYLSNWEEMGMDFCLQGPVAIDLLVRLVDRITSSSGSE